MRISHAMCRTRQWNCQKVHVYVSNGQVSRRLPLTFLFPAMLQVFCKKYILRIKWYLIFKKLKRFFFHLKSWMEILLNVICTCIGIKYFRNHPLQNCLLQKPTLPSIKIKIHDNSKLIEEEDFYLFASLKRFQDLFNRFLPSLIDQDAVRPAIFLPNEYYFRIHQRIPPRVSKVYFIERRI